LALESLHNAGYVYRDLKAENILLDEEGHIKMTDFGLAKEGAASNKGASTTCGTPSHMAPEMLQGAEYGQAVDLWALGTLMYELATGLPPFYHRNRMFMFKKILNEEPVYHEYLSEEFTSFLRGLLTKEENQRLNIEQIKSHSFFSTVCWPDVFAKKVIPPFKPEVGPKEPGQLEVSDMQMSPIETGSPIMEGSVGSFSNFSYNQDCSPRETLDDLVLEYSTVYASNS
jgi:serine/threonine protein kinase